MATTRTHESHNQERTLGRASIGGPRMSSAARSPSGTLNPRVSPTRRARLDLMTSAGLAQSEGLRLGLRHALSRAAAAPPATWPTTHLRCIVDADCTASGVAFVRYVRVFARVRCVHASNSARASHRPTRPPRGGARRCSRNRSRNGEDACLCCIRVARGEQRRLAGYGASSLPCSPSAQPPMLMPARAARSGNPGRGSGSRRACDTCGPRATTGPTRRPQDRTWCWISPAFPTRRCRSRSAAA